jgi:hypothetical protein
MNTGQDVWVSVNFENICYLCVYRHVKYLSVYEFLIIISFESENDFFCRNIIFKKFPALYVKFEFQIDFFLFDLYVN